MDKILDVTEKTIEDLSIYSKEFFPFKPITGTDYNSPGVIQINIENQDQYFLPHESFLQIEALYCSRTQDPGPLGRTHTPDPYLGPIQQKFQMLIKK